MMNNGTETNSKISINSRVLLWILGVAIATLASLLMLFPQKTKKSGNVDDNKQEILVVYGDSRDGNEIHKKIVNQIVSFGPKFVFHTGDMVNDGSNKEQWQTFNEIAAPIKNILHPILGNHEGNNQNYYDNFALPNNERWYSVDTEFVYFIMLDSNIPLDQGTEQVDWLEKELKSAKDSQKFVAVVLHHPPFSSGKHGQDADVLKLQQTLVPLLEKNTVDLVFTGHDHVYERSYKNGINYITTGASGAPLYEKTFENKYSQLFISKSNFVEVIASGNNLKLETFDELGSKVDEINITK